MVRWMNMTKISFCPCKHDHGKDRGSFEASGDERKQVVVTRLQKDETPAPDQLIIRDKDRTGKEFEISLRLKDGDNTAEFISAKVEPHRIEWCHRDSNPVLEEALVLRATQFAHRNQWEYVELVPKVKGLEGKILIKELAEHAFTNFAGLSPFKNWVEADPEMWQVCLQLANAYWTRSQIEVLVSEPFREHTIKLMAGHHKPTYPSFPDELLNVEYLGFWDLAGCLGHWSAGADNAELVINQKNANERFAKHVLRASMSRRLEGTVLSK